MPSAMIIQKCKVQSAKCKVVLILFSLLAAFLLSPFFFPLSPAYADWIFDADPPTCTITFSPASAERNTEITVTVTASDTGGSLVNISTITISPGLDTPAAANPKGYRWTPATAGTYSFTATVQDNAGNTGSCTSSSYVVTNPNCNGPISCLGCTGATANTCNLNNGTQTCTRTTYSDGEACNTVTTTPQCTYNNCSIGYDCLSALCIAPPGNLSGTCAAPGTTGSMRWSASAGATSYEVTGIPAFSPAPVIVTSTDPVTATAGTTAGSDYNWTVKACKDAVCGSPSANSSFTCAPPAPTPSASCAVPAGTPATLTWTDTNGATSYNYYVNGTLVTPAVADSPGATTYSRNYTTTPGNAYSWNVSACRNSVCSDPATATDSFTCAPPPPTGLTAVCPAPGTTAGDTARTSWVASNGATTYNVRVRGDTRVGSTAVPQITASPYNFNNLIPGYPYGTSGIVPVQNPVNTWGISATNAGGTGAEAAGAAFFCTPPLPTPNNPTLNACTSGTNNYTGTLTWGGSPYYADPDEAGLQTYQWGFWVNISVNDQIFSTYYQKWVACTNPQDRTTCTNSTPIPGAAGDRFTYFTNGNTLNTLDGETVYYFRVFNSRNSTGQSFTKTCLPYPPTNPLADCSSPGKQVSLDWDAPSPQPPTVAYYETWINSSLGRISHDYPAYNITSTADVFNTEPTYTYTWGVSACNVDGTTEQCTASTPTTPFYCDPGAWIQTKSGDVHSNEAIRTPGGP
ncbi:hypothetical protein A2871_02215 [Candidatus Daviesbacteria bacterium RIFCSPHIGHO2_01_FULL_41_23]|uniref:Fibronectin type-III domain-containing protein n=1 Tax=Candidatus Daviesbacteria bacterium RIFCSPHIGHO2_01_FULL_41_23 TaxID=1797764 RepID=A0A1F5ITW4_9BACT|nr:MAG: hypothetical protein A2871_02215 [Candidatus Daviesbacteria bacterium RIFCSPHIGHO2_01_FULL_41_23]